MNEQVRVKQSVDPHEGDATLQADAFDLGRPPEGFIDDPYPTYAALLAHAPVKKLGEKSYLLSRHADLTAVYKDTSLYSSDKTVEFGEKYGKTPLFEHHTTSLVFNDPPLHTRVRSILAGALNPRAVSALEGDVEALVGRLLDDLETKAERGEAIDLIEDFASAIPVEVIGNLLAVPYDEREPLRDWSLAILGALEPVLSEEEEARGNQAVTDFLAYLETLVGRRRETPGDPDKDMLTRLILGEKSGEKLSEAELLQNCIFILNAGHETTTNLIGNGLELLERFPDQRQRLLDDPSLIRTAVEEMLRYESSNQLGNRMTTAPVTFNGVDMPAGTFLTLCIGAANRDPAVFEEPDRFDIGRRPNRHLAFASGPHQCIGMSVARMEGQIAVARFLERFPAYHLIDGSVRSRRLRFRGYLSLPARLDR
ncbi:cytochrome P450 [Notoacmeibacter ruber]|uniref:Cytochrome P450 n=1 Tax=Notoacmeibacter ruber TaxID=2670375 RepID=A0A3L7JEN8_9HYPH|nr:cytochrome P450 [Notoacmeibacter ruber]RLQ88785.1 cytochrome P450 [Notoacmeibacter ruber]